MLCTPNGAHTRPVCLSVADVFCQGEISAGCVRHLGSHQEPAAHRRQLHLQLRDRPHQGERVPPAGS